MPIPVSINQSTGARTLWRTLLIALFSSLLPNTALKATVAPGIPIQDSSSIAGPRARKQGASNGEDSGSSFDRCRKMRSLAFNTELSGVVFADELMDADVLKGARGEEGKRIVSKGDVELRGSKKR